MDEKILLTIIDKFAAGDIAELELDDGVFHLALRRRALRRRTLQRDDPSGVGRESGGSNRTASAAASGPADAALAASGAATVRPAGHPAGAGVPVRLGLPARTEEAESAMADGDEAIVSPIVATFFRSPGPDAPAFVEVGKLVKAGDTLCILEAMKMMNHLEAEFDCRVTAVKAENGALVEYGQTLFEVVRL